MSTGRKWLVRLALTALAVLLTNDSGPRKPTNKTPKKPAN